MRVAHIITRMIIGGAQENTLLTCRELQEHSGDEVLLITGPTTGPEGRLLEQGGTTDLRVVEVPSLQRRISPTQDLRAYQALKRVIKNYRPDVVHTHSAKGGLLGRAAAWSQDVPAVIHTVHGAPFHPYQSPVSRATFRACETWAAKRCHALIGVANAMRDQLATAGVAPAEKFTTIYSGMELQPYLDADQQRSQTRRDLGYAEHHLVVGKVARLFHLKGHEYVIQAAAAAIKQVPNLRFLFIGDGVLRENLTRQIRDLELEDHIRFTGLVRPRDMPSLLGATDIVVHASLREGLARTLPQALLAGKPVISFDVDGAREVCISGSTGYLVPPRDIGQLRKAIVRLAESPDERQQFAQHGRSLCRERFDHRVMVSRIRELYQRTLSSHA